MPKAPSSNAVFAAVNKIDRALEGLSPDEVNRVLAFVVDAVTTQQNTVQVAPEASHRSAYAAE